MMFLASSSLHTNLKLLQCSGQSWSQSLGPPHWRERQAARSGRGYITSQSSSRWLRPTHEQRWLKSPEPMREEMLEKVKNNNTNDKYQRDILSFTNLSWIFAMEISPWNGLTSFCKYHLVWLLKQKNTFSPSQIWVLCSKKCQIQINLLVFKAVKDTGLSVALLISVFMMFWTNCMVSFAIPWTWIQREIL